ncbi:hypothetical protein [Alkaliphilus hydrothermalis]|uniref:Nitrogen regulatory protein PII n=1 Tax=Alkaliphilus hydrothermalis TaxID=1482730 RepID=A0ABS2NQI4_9FIRM|nr:nitrogen regulatory protein PII [Alkaliphilus hydrothermalis]
MHVLFIVLNEVEYLDEILTKFVEIGISGATILDSHGMACELCKYDQKIPIIGSLRSFLDSSRPYNKTIFTVVEREELADKAMEAVNEIVHDVSKPGHGLMFTVPVGKIWGVPKKIE